MSSKLKILSRLIVLIILVSLLLISFSVNTEAASFSITSGISSTTVGNSYTIKINANGLTGRFNITHSSNVSVNVSSVWVENGVADSTIRVTTQSTGNATVTVTPESIADAETGEVLNLSAKTDTVTVKAKSSNSNTGSGSSGSSGGNSGSSSNNTAPATAPSFSSRDETVYATDSVNIRSSYSTSSSVVGSLDVGDSVKRTGIATKAVNGITWSRVSYNGQTAYISSSYLTTEEPEEEEKSNNKNLKSLVIAGYELTPEFSSDVTEYSLAINDDIDVLQVEAVAEDDKAKVEITGNNNLLIGENTIEIKVTAEDETERTYKINVTKGKELEIQLSGITIAGYALTPEFSSDVYEYTLNIDDTSVTSLNIDTESNVENAVIEVVGNNELKLGENIITILVKSEDGEETSTYQIIVNIEEKVEPQIIAGIDNNDLYLYGGIGIAVLIVILIIIIVIVKRRNREDDDFGTYYGGFNSLDNDKNERDNPKTDNDNKVIEDNSNETTTDIKKDKKDIIEENFGTNLSNIDFNDDDNKVTTRKKGKHF